MGAPERRSQQCAAKSVDIDLLDDLGQERWELVTITPNKMAYLKLRNAGGPIWLPLRRPSYPLPSGDPCPDCNPLHQDSDKLGGDEAIRRIARMRGR